MKIIVNILKLLYDKTMIKLMVTVIRKSKDDVNDSKYDKNPLRNL